MAYQLAGHIADSCDEANPCGSLAEAEGMLREALPLWSATTYSEQKVRTLKCVTLARLAIVLGKLHKYDEQMEVRQSLQMLQVELEELGL
eukprot:451484-Prymnesium_polylepis.1